MCCWSTARALGDSLYQVLISYQTLSTGRISLQTYRLWKGQAGPCWSGASRPVLAVWSFPLHTLRRFCPCHLCYPSDIWWLDKAERHCKVRWWSEKIIATGMSQPKAFGHLTHLTLILGKDCTQRAGDLPFCTPQVCTWQFEVTTSNANWS